MSRSRFIYFTQTPPQKDLEKLILQFLGGVGQVKWDQDRFFVTLPGKHSWALDELGIYSRPKPKKAERWIEVIPSYEVEEISIDVLTRFQDEFTDALADAIASLIAWAWHGVMEE